MTLCAHHTHQEHLLPKCVKTQGRTALTTSREMISEEVAIWEIIV